MGFEEVKEDETIEELKCKAIILKIKPDQNFLETSEKAEIEDTTLYAIQARKIAFNWKRNKEV
ncbi:MAG: hypothetical protein ACXADY_03995 [Candidatus Hodarchaeales archaeon]|jgi:hypothetical protein